MKILILSKTLDSEGGVANFVRMLLNCLDPTFDVIHFTIGSKRTGASRLKARTSFLVYCWKLFRQISIFKPDIVHINPSLNLNSLIRDSIFLLIARLARRNQPIMSFFHGWDLRTQRIIDNNWILKKLFVRIYKNSDTIIVLSKIFEKKLIEWGLVPSNIHILPTMFDGRLFQGYKYNISFKGKQILFLSRLVKAKGIYELLEGFRLTLYKHPDLKLIIAGDGEEKKGIIDWIHHNNLSDSISLPGYLQGHQKASALIESDFFILPSSHHEGLPISMLEAMAAGQFLITTPVGGIPEHIIDGENGIILSQPSSKEVNRSLIRCINDLEFCRKVQTNNIQQAWQFYESSKVTQSIVKLYQCASKAHQNHILKANAS